MTAALRLGGVDAIGGIRYTGSFFRIHLCRGDVEGDSGQQGDSGEITTKAQPKTRDPSVQYRQNSKGQRLTEVPDTMDDLNKNKPGV